MGQEYKIGKLAEKSGVSRRTIHYYLSRGLLPPPKGAGPQSFYTEEHLLRLELLKKLQEKYWPLDKIRGRLNALTFEEVKKELKEFERHAKEKPGIPAFALEFKLSDAENITEYLKIDMALGISLFFPKKLPEKYLDAVLDIAKYARKLLPSETK
jgi:DNA-binding transcriptional MerR regulator